MSTARMLRASLATLIVATACADEPTTAPTVAPAKMPADLALAFPTVSDALLSPVERTELTPPAAPARVFSDEEPDPSDPEDAVATIISPYTRVGFMPGYAYSLGRHGYTGNVGEVTTTATVTFEGEYLGESTKTAVQSIPFLVDFGQVKYIVIEAYVFTDHECGLRVDGHSTHKAKWQFFTGTGVSNFGEAQRDTQAFPPYEQPPCGEEEHEEDAYVAIPGDGPMEVEGGWVTCWYLVTYYVDTGEIISADLLYCDDVEYV